MSEVCEHNVTLSKCMSAGKDFDRIMNRFCEIDLDGDGKITNHELYKFFEEQKYSEEETDYMMRMTDPRLNKKQTVEFHEFFFMMWPQTKKMRTG